MRVAEVIIGLLDYVVRKESVPSQVKRCTSRFFEKPERAKISFRFKRARLSIEQASSTYGLAGAIFWLDLRANQSRIRRFDGSCIGT